MRLSDLTGIEMVEREQSSPAVKADLPVNCTPHAITLRRPDGTDLTIPPSGTVARVETVETVTGICSATGLPIVERTMGTVTGLPDSGMCIVSSLVLAACAGMAGVYAPDTGPTAIRDDRGQIVAVTRLIAA